MSTLSARVARPFPAALLAAAAAVSVLHPGAARAQDAPGAKEPPLITRYQGSRLIAFQDDAFASVQVPTGYERNGGKWLQAQTLEGERQRFVLLAPARRTALEVQRNYEAALIAAGGRKVISCGPRDACAHDASQLQGDYTGWLSSDPGLKSKLDVAFPAMNGSGDGYHALFRIDKGGATTWVTVLSVEGAKEGTATVLDFIQPKAMEGGRVTLATSAAIAGGLKTEGRMAIYGVNFDTGKADIRADARPQLAEMASALKSQPALKVLIVGHTDNQGEFGANLALSQHRAEAILAALAHDYAIAPTRLRAFGDANAAPVAPNSTEDGRARNRRVELVVQ